MIWDPGGYRHPARRQVVIADRTVLLPSDIPLAPRRTSEDRYVPLRRSYAGRVEPTTIGNLQGRFALAPLVDKADEIAGETRANMVHTLRWFRVQFRSWLHIIDDVRSGAVDAHRVSIASAAFRPNFHAARAAEHLQMEQWTETTMRYVQAGETLVRDVIVAALAEHLDVDLTKAEATTYWRKAATKVAALADVDLESEPEWAAFNAVYNDRNTRFAHGHEEASIEDALRALDAWEGLRRLMQTRFLTQGISLDALQSRVLHERVEQYSDEDRQEASDAVAAANAAMAKGRDLLRRAVAEHQPRHPAALREFYNALSSAERDVADAAAADAMTAGFERVREAWERVTDHDAILTEAVFGP